MLLLLGWYRNSEVEPDFPEVVRDLSSRLNEKLIFILVSDKRCSSLSEKWQRELPNKLELER